MGRFYSFMVGLLPAGFLLVIGLVITLTTQPSSAVPIQDIPDEWSVMYRCRRCAKVFYESGSLNQELAAGRLLKVHEGCAQDIRGVADLIGGRWHIAHFDR